MLARWLTVFFVQCTFIPAARIFYGLLNIHCSAFIAVLYACFNGLPNIDPVHEIFPSRRIRQRIQQPVCLLFDALGFHCF